MTRGGTGLGAAAMAALMIGSPAMAAPAAPADLAGLQQQLNALRSEYDAKINDLETRLKAVEAEVAASRAAAPQATAQAEPAPDAAPGEVMIADSEAPAPEPVAAPAQPAAPPPPVVETRLQQQDQKIDDLVARRKLEAWGIEIDKLTPEQEKYLNSWNV